MINEHWTVLDEEKTRKFIAEVRDPEFAELFDGPSYELWGYPLEFFDGYWRYSLNNTSVIPYFSMDYISNGENHYYLDGSEHPIALLLRRGALRLNTENVLDYLDFFDDVVFDPTRKVKFIVDAYDTGYAGASAMGHHFKAIEYTAQRSIDELDDHFMLTLPALFNGETVQASVRVNKTGEINIVSPYSADLMGRTYDVMQPLRYKHIHSKSIVQENAAIIRRSALGAEMLDFAASKGIQIEPLAGITRKPSWTDGRKAFLTVPIDVSGSSPYQIIDLAAVLREAELFYFPPLEEEAGVPPPNWEEQNHGRNLDILLTLCRIVEELEGAGYSLALEKLRGMGLERLYTGYKNGLPLEQLMDIYAEIYEV
jgi:hypothetical protein